MPAQKVSRSVTEVTVRGDSVLLRMPVAGSSYAACFDAAKHEPNGWWLQGGVKARVLLHYLPMPTASGAGTRLALPYGEEEVVFNTPFPG